MHATGDLTLSDEVRFAPSPEVIGQNKVITKSPPSGDKENYHPDMAPSTSRSHTLPPTSDLRLKVSVNKSGYLELNLSGRNFRDVPPEVWNYGRLEALRLGTNRLRSLPTAIGQLRKLKILHVQQNALVVLPDTIANCAHLTEIDLCSNHLSTLPPSLFQLKYMRMLRLANNQFESIPHEMGEMTSLWYLNISGNKLWHLPYSLQSLQNLHHLDMSRNLFDQLPICVCQMVNLETLSLKHNKMINLPTDAEELVNLRELNMSYNRLESLPLVISSLRSLQSLDISHNKISNIPPRLSKIPLKNLVAHNNQIATVPGNLESLEILNVAHNRMSNFSVARMKRLKQLLASHNMIENMPLGICNLPELEALKLDHNQITYISQDIALLQQLRTLDLSYNRLNSLPQVITELERLENFNIKGNKIDPRLAYLPQVRQRVINKQKDGPEPARVNAATISKKSTIEQEFQTPKPKKKRFGGWFRSRSHSPGKDDQSPAGTVAPHTRSREIVTAKSAPRVRSRPPLDYQPTSHSLPSFFSAPRSRKTGLTQDATIAETSVARRSTMPATTTARASTLPESFDPPETLRSEHRGRSRSRSKSTLANSYTRGWVAAINKAHKPPSVNSTAVTVNDSVGDNLSLGDYDFELHPPAVKDRRLLGVVSEVENLLNKQVMSPVQNRRTSFFKTSPRDNATLRTQHSLMMDPYENDEELFYNTIQQPQENNNNIQDNGHLPRAVLDGNSLLRTRMDMFEVTPSGGMFKSTVDPNVSVYFPVHSVDQPLTITMQIEQVDQKAVEKARKSDPDLNNILSVGNIVHIHQSKNINFLEQVTMTIPEPPLKRRGHIHLINYKDDNTCSPCPPMYKSNKGYISLQTWHFSGKGAVLTRSKCKYKACSTMEHLLNHLYV